MRRRREAKRVDRRFAREAEANLEQGAGGIDVEQRELFDGDASGFAFEPSRPGDVEKRRRPEAIRTAGGVRLARHRRGGGDANIVETGRVEDFDRGAGERRDREMQAAALGIARRATRRQARQAP